MCFKLVIGADESVELVLKIKCKYKWACLSDFEAFIGGPWNVGKSAKHSIVLLRFADYQGDSFIVDELMELIGLKSISWGPIYQFTCIEIISFLDSSYQLKIASDTLILSIFLNDFCVKEFQLFNVLRIWPWSTTYSTLLTWFITHLSFKIIYDICFYYNCDIIFDKYLKKIWLS